MTKKYFTDFFRLGWRLALVDFKLRNEGSYLGNVWYVINPLLLFGVLYFVFVDRIVSEIENYPAYLIIGILMFNFFSRTTLELTGIIRESMLIKSFAFPRESLVLSVVIKHLLAHLFETVVFFALLTFLGISFLWVLLYVAIALLFAAFVYGVGLILSSVTVYLVDLGNVWQFFSFLLFFATPVFYVVEQGTMVLAANMFNPLYHFFTVAREIIVYETLPSSMSIGIVLAAPIITILVGQIIFNRCKGRFAELI